MKNKANSTSSLISSAFAALLLASTFTVSAAFAETTGTPTEAQIQAHYNEGAANTSQGKPTSSDLLTLPHSNLEIDDGAFWVRKWDLNKPAGVSLKSVINFDQSLLLTFSGADYTYLNKQKATSFKSTGPSQYEWSFSDANVDYKRTYTVEGEAVVVNVAVQFKQKTPQKAYLNLVSRGMADDVEKRDREFFYFTDSKIERKNIDKGVDATEIATPVKWLGAGSRYFVFAVMPTGAPAERVLLQSTGQYEAQGSFQYPVANNAFNASFKVVFLPKQLDLLRSVDKSFDTTVNLGFFAFLAYPILWALKYIYSLVGNYGVAIIILTVIIKLLTFPLVYKSMKGMRKMAEFQPKMKALQDKYKDDKTRLNQEMMVMMKSSGYNPMAGCFPMLIQMPIFFALYSVLYAAVELYHAPFFGWLTDLSAKDPYYITPVLMAIIMFLQQKVTPPSPGMDPSQRKVMMFMPLIFGAFMITTPSGLCVYMVVNATVSILQQQLLNKKLGIPGQTAVVETTF